MSGRLARGLAITLLVGSVALQAVEVILIILTWSVPRGQGLNDPGTSLAFVVANLSFPIVGAILVWNRPSNLIGWLCLALGVAGHDILLGRYLAYTLLVSPETRLPSLLAIASLLPNLWMVPASCFLLMVTVFPTGVPASRGMRIAALLVPLVAVLSIVLTAIQPGRLPPPFERYENIIGIRGLDFSGEVGEALTGVFALTGVAIAMDMIRRFRRSTGDERQQFKWFVYASSWIPVLMVLYILTSLVEPDVVYVIDAMFPFALMGVTIA
jgi:hypothetical protein